MIGRTKERTSEGTDEQKNKRTYEPISDRTNESTNERAKKRKNEHTNGWIYLESVTSIKLEWCVSTVERYVKNQKASELPKRTRWKIDVSREDPWSEWNMTKGAFGPSRFLVYLLKVNENRHHNPTFTVVNFKVNRSFCLATLLIWLFCLYLPGWCLPAVLPSARRVSHRSSGAVAFRWCLQGFNPRSDLSALCLAAVLVYTIFWNCSHWNSGG